MGVFDVVLMIFPRRNELPAVCMPFEGEDLGCELIMVIFYWMVGLFFCMDNSRGDVCEFVEPVFFDFAEPSIALLYCEPTRQVLVFVGVHTIPQLK